MPELPEVETIVRDLNKKIKGKVIKSVQVKVPKLVKNLNTKFVQALLGQKIGKVSRRAKVIKVEIGNVSHGFSAKGRPASGWKTQINLVLLIHLKLTGQLIFRDKKGLKNLANKFTHIIFTFTDGSQLFYNDLRKFGWMNLVSKSDADKLLEQEFGIEPLSPEFTLNKFKEIFAKKGSQPVKKVLMDQKNIAGLGNIYADEFCFYASIKPMRRVKSLTPGEVKKLWQGIRSILKQAIKHRGTSADSYVDASGRQGGHVPYLKVYGRTGQKCRRPGCIGTVKKIKFGGRGTHYCGGCQN